MEFNKSVFFNNCESLIKRDSIVLTESHKIIISYITNGDKLEFSRKTLVFNTVLQRKMEFTQGCDRHVTSEWKDSQLHFSIRIVSNNTEEALPIVSRNIKDTVSNIKGLVTERMPYRISSEQTSCEAVLDEVLDEIRGPLAQYLRERLSGFSEEVTRYWLDNNGYLQEDLRRGDKKRRRSSSPKRRDLSPPREVADISNIEQNEG